MDARRDSAASSRAFRRTEVEEFQIPSAMASFILSIFFVISLYYATIAASGEDSIYLRCRSMTASAMRPISSSERTWSRTKEITACSR